jgi:hypothetical protein
MDGKNMNTRILIAAIVTSFVSSVVLGQMGGYSGGMTQSQPPQTSTDRTQQKTSTTTTKKVMPAGVKAYVDEQLANSKDKKFHVSINGRDLALTPTTFHAEKKMGGNKSSTAVDMKGTDGKAYEIDFVSSGGQVTGASVGKVNGKSPSSQ